MFVRHAGTGFTRMPKPMRKDLERALQMLSMPHYLRLQEHSMSEPTVTPSGGIFWSVRDVLMRAFKPAPPPEEEVYYPFGAGHIRLPVRRDADDKPFVIVFEECRRLEKPQDPIGREIIWIKRRAPPNGEKP